jgi:chitodextrinase
VGWFSEYNAPGQVQVSDNVNGAWTRAPGALTFQGGTGDVALYYVANTKAASGGLTVTVAAGAVTFFQVAVAEYSGMAAAGPLDQLATRTAIGTAVDTGATASVGAGELVYSALVTGGSPGWVTLGSSHGVGLTLRSQISSGAVSEQDILSSAAGAQDATATLGASTDWYAVTAVFLPASVGDTTAPTTPTGLHTTSVASTSVGLVWSASTDNVGVRGYTVYRNGVALATTAPTTTSYNDQTVVPGPTYTYTVDAFDAAGNHSAPSAGLPVTTPGASPAFVQATSGTTGKVASTTLSLSKPVAQGDLLVGWFAQYNAAGHVQVSDNVNGAWMRAPAAVAFQNDTGDIALYYLPNAKAAPGGITITIGAGAPAYFESTVAEYSGIAVAGPLDSIASARDVTNVVDTGATAAVGAGELVYSALVTGGNPGSVTAGSSNGVGLTPRSQASSGAVYEQDVLSSAAGPQDAMATLGTSTDWYAVTAVFLPTSVGDTVPPATPAGLQTTSVASTVVSLNWSASTDNVGVRGYTVYRNGTPIAITDRFTTYYSDQTVVSGAANTYTVDAFDAAGNHSAPSQGLQVAIPAKSPAFVQGAADSPGNRLLSTTATLSNPVAQGDLLVGWFAQYNTSGQVQVSDPVNGAWTRGISETFRNGTGDLALYYVQNAKAAPNGLTITISANAPAYLPYALAEYSGVATSGALDQSAVGSGTGTRADSGPTAPIAAGELVFGGMLTAGQPLTVSPGFSQGAPFILDWHNGSQSADAEAILSSAAGAQDATFSSARSDDWYAVVATFRPS